MHQRGKEGGKREKERALESLFLKSIFLFLVEFEDLYYIYLRKKLFWVFTRVWSSLELLVLLGMLGEVRRWSCQEWWVQFAGEVARTWLCIVGRFVNPDTSSSGTRTFQVSSSSVKVFVDILSYFVGTRVCVWAWPWYPGMYVEVGVWLQGVSYLFHHVENREVPGPELRLSCLETSTCPCWAISTALS